MNPFITLTKINNGGKVRINVNHIVAYSLRSFKKQYGQDVAPTYTYILVQGGTGCSREVTETPEEIDEMISRTFLTLITHVG